VKRQCVPWTTDQHLKESIATGRNDNNVKNRFRTAFPSQPYEQSQCFGENTTRRKIPLASKRRLSGPHLHEIPDPDLLGVVNDILSLSAKVHLIYE
jgi:hypothetical protein